MIGNRSRARRFAMQLIYQICPTHLHLTEAAEGGLDKKSVSGSAPVKVESLPRIFAEFWLGVHERIEPEVKEFCEALVHGVVAHEKEITATIARAAENWKTSRMARVDLSILRLAVYELYHRPEVPLEVAINEAVELAKGFSTKDSSAFVNGILDRIAKEKPSAA